MLSPGFPSITFVFHTIAIKRSVGGTNIKKKIKNLREKFMGMEGYMVLCIVLTRVML